MKLAEKLSEMKFRPHSGVVMGRCGSDAESGEAYTRVSVAVRERKSKQDGDPGPVWYSVFTTRPDARARLKLARKGHGIKVAGDIRLEEYERDGEQRERRTLFVSGAEDVYLEFRDGGGQWVPLLQEDDEGEGAADEGEEWDI